RDRDPLLHPARKVVRIGTGKILKLHEAKLFERDGLALGLWQALHFEPKSHIAKRSAPGKKLGKILKHDAAIHAVAPHRLAADADFASARRDKSRDDVEQRR